MITLIIGTVSSGKSALAEDLAQESGGTLYYLATMKVCDEEGRKRVLRHRKAREGKGFHSIERQLRIADAITDFKRPGEATVLLECIANLVANEMHDNPERNRETLAEEIAGEVVLLAAAVRHLIVVTNEYEPDGEGYDDSTREYVSELAGVNALLVKKADRIIDVRKSTEEVRQ